MNLPNLPTDALYKFMTVLGLAGVMFFSYRVDSLFKEMERSGTEQLNSLVKYNLDTFYITRQLLVNNKKLEGINNSLKGKKNPFIGFNDINEAAEFYKDDSKWDVYKFIFENKTDIFPYFNLINS